MPKGRRTESFRNIPGHQGKGFRNNRCRTLQNFLGDQKYTQQIPSLKTAKILFESASFAKIKTNTKTYKMLPLELHS